MYSYKTGLGQVWVGSKLPPNPANNIIWLRPSDDHRVLWEIRTYNIYKEKWEVLTSAALTADGLLILIRDLEKRCKSLEELKVVLYDTIQNLTPEEQKIARQNIGAISLEDLHLDENVTRLAIELTINDEKVYSVVTPLETLTEHYRKFLADPTKYVWQLYLKVGEDQLGLVPLFIVTYGGLHIGFYSPDTSGETKYVSLNTNGDVVIRATVNNYGPTLVEVVQSTGDSTEAVMSQKTVTEELDKKASLESVTDSISVHNTSSTSHADIRELLNTCVGLPAYDSSSYKITFTTLAGASVEIDLPIEQLALRYNVETESIEFDNADGTTTSIPVSAFVKVYLGSIGEQIQISIDNQNTIHATLLKNSVSWDHLSVELQQRVNDHVTTTDFAEKTIRNDIEQSLSMEAQNQALENIGADLMVIDLVNGQATLTDEQEARLLSCKGVILRGTVNAGKEVLTKIYFSDYQGGDQVSFWAVRNNRYILQCIYTKSTKLFRFLTSASFIDPNAVSIKMQTLNATQQEQAWSNLGLDLVVLKFPEGVTSVTLTDEEDAKLAAGAAVLVTVDGTNTSTGVHNADNHIFASYSFTIKPEPHYYSLWSQTSVLYCSYKKASKTFVYNGSLRLNDIGALRTDRLTSLSGAQQSQAFENLGWKVHVISESVIGSSDAVSDDEKAARLAATALLVKETGEMYIYGHNSSSTPSDRRFYRFRDTKTLALLNVVTTTGLITQPPFVNIYDENAVSFNINQSGVSDDRKNKALGNIGIDLVRIPHSLLGTTLSDEMFAVLDNARGIIVVNTSSNYDNPTVFIKGINSSRACYFVSHNTGTTYCQIQLNKSTKILSNISAGLTYEGSVRYAEEQSLTTAQQERALDNIGFPLVHLDFALIGTTLDDNIYNAVASAKGIILENVPDGNNAPSLYLVGNSDTVTTIFVSEFNARVWFVLTLSHTSKKLSLISTGYATDVVRYREGQNLTNTQKDTALSNIGLDFVHIDYSLLGTTLTDDQVESVTNAKGIIITNIPDSSIPTIYLAGSKPSSDALVFLSLYLDAYISTIKFTISTKTLGKPSLRITTAGAVTFTPQTITDAQKQQARSNINAVGSSMIKGVEVVYGTAPMQEDNILYIELEETT